MAGHDGIFFAASCNFERRKRCIGACTSLFSGKMACFNGFSFKYSFSTPTETGLSMGSPRNWAFSRLRKFLIEVAGEEMESLFVDIMVVESWISMNTRVNAASARAEIIVGI